MVNAFDASELAVDCHFLGGIPGGGDFLNPVRVSRDKK